MTTNNIIILTINNNNPQEEWAPNNAVNTLFTFMPKVELGELPVTTVKAILEDVKFVSKNKPVFVILDNRLVVYNGFKGTTKLPYEWTGDYDWTDEVYGLEEFNKEHFESLYEKLGFIPFHGMPRTRGTYHYGCWLEKKTNK